MENKRRICSICNRIFANGKAMGGHMRSHFAKAPIPPKPNPNPLPIPDNPSSSQISTPVKSDLADKESDTDSPRNSNLAQRRSKRRPKSAVDKVQLQVQLSVHPEPETESVSSISEAFRVEEVAMCLLMLKTEKWTKGKKKEVKRGRGEVNEEDDDDESFCITHARSGKAHNKYKCGTCKKKFRSYQALGGHKASHKDIKKCDPDEVGGVNGDVNLRNFKCPFCDKVFESGQALGGHKKVHYSSSSVAMKSPEKSSNQHNLDLNMLPEEDEVSQVECSTV